MRISTVTIFEQSVSNLHRQQQNFIKVGQQIASGKRVVNPSDDPQAAARAVGVSQAKSVTEQHTQARVSARNALAQEEGVLDGISDALVRARTLMVQASSETLSDTDRDSVATELRGIRESLLGQSNATDGNGVYLFGGFDDGSAPFVEDATGAVTYVGDTNVREVRIDASRLLPTGHNGEQVFRTVHTSAGYVAEADAANAGTLEFNGPRVVDATDPDYGNAFTLSFNEAGGNYSYSVNGGAAQPWAPGASVTFGGLNLSLEGTPADGDSIEVAPAQQMNTDLFATLDKTIAALEQSSTTPVESARRSNTMKTALREVDNSLDNILTVRASVGARLNELDTVDQVSEKRMLDYESKLSDLVDLDYVEAISEYSRRQIGLEAAQKTFADLSSLSLFDRL